MREPEVFSVMTVDVVTVRLDTPFKDIARLLARHAISAVPVMDGSVVAGVVSEADLLAKQEYRDGGGALPAGTAREAGLRKSLGVTASHVMTSPAVLVDPTAPVAEAVRLLSQAGVRRLFVVDRAGRLVGVVARRDLLRAYLRDDEDLRDDIRREVFQGALSVDPASIGVRVDGGAVVLTGDVGRRGAVELALRLIRALPGVVTVRSELTYRIDDVEVE